MCGFDPRASCCRKEVCFLSRADPLSVFILNGLVLSFGTEKEKGFDFAFLER